MSEPLDTVRAIGFSQFLPDRRHGAIMPIKADESALLLRAGLPVNAVFGAGGMALIVENNLSQVVAVAKMRGLLMTDGAGI